MMPAASPAHYADPMTRNPNTHAFSCYVLTLMKYMEPQLVTSLLKIDVAWPAFSRHEI